ncbi:MAG: saccharopine dehydrogenase NADP-binding domain-containing protein, partial [Cyanobacteria bacterium P01_C01_bin.73]
MLGATGFVGQILCRYLLQHVNQADADKTVKWAIAGRSPAKLDDLKAALGAAAANLPSLIVDVSDPASVQTLCAQARVIISTVGPYALRGELLVKTCAETGTDYCDLTG